MGLPQLLRVHALQCKGVELYHGAHLLKIRSAKNEGPPLQGTYPVFYADRSWSHCKTSI